MSALCAGVRQGCTSITIDAYALVVGRLHLQCWPARRAGAHRVCVAGRVGCRNPNAGLRGAQGHIVFASPAFAHRLPQVFPRPGAFEPERFAPPRDEDKAAPFSFIGFGGGRHGCMGSNFAYLQARASPSAAPQAECFARHRRLPTQLRRAHL